ncbi:MAG: hypothetical protein JWL97_1290 [Gemmatimonadales bacterium]|jgi:hypothetical protein|nr:hypothetical protein [Gemmatimonadales bacterium]
MGVCRIPMQPAGSTLLRIHYAGRGADRAYREAGEPEPSLTPSALDAVHLATTFLETT